jgi:SAM-dependent methyltransferase
MGLHLTPLRACALTYIVLTALFVAYEFPYHTDPVTKVVFHPGAQHFYDQAYSAPSSPEQEAKEEIYVNVATVAAERSHIREQAAAFVRQYGLENKRILDVGSGRGYLQDSVADYTGLDISGAVSRFYHKPFVQASATAMPFPDSEFDAMWSIWVLEHVPNPEQMLSEMRRVTKSGGYLLLLPAWDCSPFAANGYRVRPYSDFGLGGKVVKTAVPVLESPGVSALAIYPARIMRWMWSKLKGGPTALHYRLLTPNYDQYWMSDSDALNSIDSYEAYLWFTSRGDTCLNCGSALGELTTWPPTLLIRVNKSNSNSASSERQHIAAHTLPIPRP